MSSHLLTGEVTPAVRLELSPVPLGVVALSTSLVCLRLPVLFDSKWAWVASLLPLVAAAYVSVLSFPRVEQWRFGAPVLLAVGVIIVGLLRAGAVGNVYTWSVSVDEAIRWITLPARIIRQAVLPTPMLGHARVTE